MLRAKVGSEKGSDPGPVCPARVFFGQIVDRSREK